MGAIDFLLILALAFAALVGLLTGLAASLINLAGMFVGVVLAVEFAVPLSEKLGFLSSPTLARLVAFLAILIAVLIVASLFASLVRRFLSWVGLGWLDRLGGLLFGIAGGVVFWGALLTFLARLSLFQAEALASRSPVAAFLLATFKWFFGNSQ